MSVIDDGPGGYEYQYLASTYVILHFLKEGELSEIFIDHIDREDLTLSFKIKGSSKLSIFDFEFKNRASTLDHEFFASCFSKFSAYKSDQNILSKLLDKKIDKYFLFSSARADDFASLLKINGDKYSFAQVSGIRKKGDLAALLLKMDAQFPIAPKGQKKLRKDFVSQQAKNTDLKDLDKALDKVIVLDTLSTQELFRVIEYFLTELFIPVSIHRLVIRELVELVKDSRASGRNILQQFDDLLTRYIKNIPKPEAGYVESGIEPPLYEKLKKEKLVLLTGVPLCGKTQTALFIASKLVTDHPSIAYLPTIDIREAEKFLFDNIHEARICYLEDPLGEFYKPENINLYKQLENLVGHLPSDKQRYLIVTSKIQAVESLRESYYLDGYTWDDVTIKSTEFLLGLWAEITLRNTSLSASYIKLVKKTILQGTPNDQLQPGQLVHLSLHPERLTARTVDAVKHLANFRAMDVTQYIIEKGSDVMMAMQIMGVSSTTLTGLQLADLQFLMDTRPDYLPGINKFDTKSTGSSLFDTIQPPNYEIAIYENLNGDSKGIRTALSKLIDMRLIRYEQTEYRFVHPMYQEAARNLLDATNPDRFAETISLLRKTIAGLNVKAGLQVVKNLYLITNGCQEKVQRDQLFDIAFSGLRSTFMVIRDQSLLYLIDHFNDLSATIQKEIKERIHSRADFKTSSYRWQNDIPFVPDKEHLTSAWRDIRDHFIDRRKIYKQWYKFLSGQIQLNTYQSWKLLKAIKETTKNRKRRIDLAVEPLLYFLRFEETFIREPAAFLIAASITDANAGLIYDLYEEGDPFVNYQIIKGLFRSWPYLQDALVKEKMLQFMMSVFDNVFIVLNSIELFTQFSAGHSSYAFDWRDDIEDTAAPDMWFLWGALMVVLFKHLPPKLHLNTGRFQSTLIEAQVTIDTKCNVLNAYLDWLPAHLKEAGYNTSISDSLIYFFTDNVSLIPALERLALIKRFFTIENKIFLAHAWRSFIHFWESFSIDEKQLLVENVKVASDLSKAVALTTDTFPENIQIALLGEVITGKPISDLLNVITEGRMLECLSTLYIYPPTLDFNYRGTSFWNQFLGYYIDKPGEKGFKIALAVFFSDILVFRSTRKGLWANSRAILTTLLTNGTDETKLLIFGHLLCDISDNNRSDAGPYLNLLFESCGPQLKEEFGKKMLQFVEAISNEHNMRCIPKEAYRDYVKPKITFDLFIAEILDPKSELKPDDFYIGFTRIIIMTFEKKDIRTLEGILAFREWKDLNPELFSKEEAELIERYLTDFQEIAQEQMRSLREPIEESIGEFLPKELR